MRNANLRHRMGTNPHLFYPLQGLGTTARELATAGFPLGTPLHLGALQCDQDGNCYDDDGNLVTSGGFAVNDPTDTVPATGIVPVSQLPITSGGNPLGTAAATGPSYPTSLAATLANDATQIIAPVVKAATTTQPYYVTNPATGQAALYNPNTGQFVSATSAALSSISPLTLLVGVGLLAAFAFSKK